jgi:hypothetical protein
MAAHEAEAQKIATAMANYGSVHPLKALAFQLFQERKKDKTPGDDKSDWYRSEQLIEEERKRHTLEGIIRELNKSD